MQPPFVDFTLDLGRQDIFFKGMDEYQDLLNGREDLGETLFGETITWTPHDPDNPNCNAVTYLNCTSSDQFTCKDTDNFFPFEKGF